MYMFIYILNGITVTLGQFLFGSNLHPIDGAYWSSESRAYRFVVAVAYRYVDVTTLHWHCIPGYMGTCIFPLFHSKFSFTSGVWGLLGDSCLEIDLIFLSLGFPHRVVWGGNIRALGCHGNFFGSHNSNARSIIYLQSQKGKIAYVPLDLVYDYIYIAELNTRLRVGWKTLSNSNFKLKFQTQTWI